MRSLLATCALLAPLLGSCSTTITVPVAVVGSKGEILRGEATTGLDGGTFEATNGKLSCGGTFDPSGGSRTVAVAAKCSDGRAAIGTAFRNTATSGSGTLRLSDGSIASFIFGSGATGVQ